MPTYKHGIEVWTEDEVKKMFNALPQQERIRLLTILSCLSEISDRTSGMSDASCLVLEASVAMEVPGRISYDQQEAASVPKACMHFIEALRVFHRTPE